MLAEMSRVKAAYMARADQAGLEFL